MSRRVEGDRVKGTCDSSSSFFIHCPSMFCRTSSFSLHRNRQFCSVQSDGGMSVGQTSGE